MPEAWVYESALRRAGIPYLTIQGKGFYEREEITDLFSYFASSIIRPTIWRSQRCSGLPCVESRTTRCWRFGAAQRHKGWSVEHCDDGAEFEISLTDALRAS